MLKSTQTIMIEVEGWEIEFKLDLEFTVDPGEKGDWDTPAHDPYIEDLQFNDVQAAKAIKFQMLELQRIEKIKPVVYDIDIVLGDLQEQIDKDDLLQIELYNVAQENYLDCMIDYYESKRDEERGF